MATETDTFTVKGQNLAEGMVIDFEGELAGMPDGSSMYVGEAEVTFIEEPDGLGDFIGIYCKPVDTALEVYAHGWPKRDYKVVG